MQMQHKIAVLAFALGFLAAPGLGVAAADACPPCCNQAADAACEAGALPCATLASTPCCGAAAPAPVLPAKQSSEAPSFSTGVTHCIAQSLPPRCDAAPPVDGDLTLLTSALRLSVVLRT